MAGSFCNFVTRKKEKCLREGLITNSYPSKSQDGKGISEFACSLVLSMGVSPCPLQRLPGWTGFCPQGVHPSVRCHISQKEGKHRRGSQRATGIQGRMNPWGSQDAEVFEMGPEGGQRETDWQGETHEGTWVGKSAQARGPCEWVSSPQNLTSAGRGG